MICCLISYWRITLGGPQFWNWRYAVWETRFNLVWTSMEMVDRRTRFAIDWRIVNSFLLLSFVCFTVLLPISLDLRIGLSLNQCLMFLLAAGFYCMVVINPFLAREFRKFNPGHGQVANTPPLHETIFFFSILSTIPGLVLTILIFYLRWIIRALFSSTFAMIPLFLAHLPVICMTCWGKLWKDAVYVIPLVTLSCENCIFCIL
jgi:hypothetical protein